MNLLYGVTIFLGALVAVYLIGAALTMVLEWAGW